MKAGTIYSCAYKDQPRNRKERQVRSPCVPTKIDPEKKKKAKNDILVWLQTSSWQESAVDNKTL